MKPSPRQKAREWWIARVVQPGAHYGYETLWGSYRDARGWAIGNPLGPCEVAHVREVLPSKPKRKAKQR